MLEKDPMSIADGVGAVFHGQDAVYRGIHENHREEVLTLLKCGLIEELVAQGLFPKTWIAQQHIEGYKLVLEHERIQPITYPFEWSPEMIRRTGMQVLRISAIANKYGYELKDAHPFNFVFRNLTPMLVDMGSLIRLDEMPGWRAQSEFKQCYLYPLHAYSRGLHTMFAGAFRGAGNGLRQAEYLLTIHPLLRILGVRRMDKLCRYWRAYFNPRVLTDEVIQTELKAPLLQAIARLVRSSKRLPFRTPNHKRLGNALRRINLRPSTRWSDYHTELMAKGQIELSDRLQHVVDIARELAPVRVLDLAGNQGAVARSLARLPSVRQTVCADYDEGAIDSLLRSADSSESITAAVFNMMGDALPAETLARPKRLKSDLVLALAITHHLILAQNYNLDSIFEALARFTSTWLMLEFMPMGLYGGAHRPSVPDWYTQDWFEQELNKRFIIVSAKLVETNRVLYLAKLRGT